jgi:hypothetical protein
VAASVFEHLQGLGQLEAVHGNMDEEQLRRLLPREHVVEVGDARIGLVHNAGPREGRAARLAARFQGCDAVVYGHTHVPEAARHEGMWVLNPGSPTERRRAPAHSLLMLRVDGRTIEPRLVTLPT